VLRRIILNLEVFITAAIKVALKRLPGLGNLAQLTDFQKYIYSGGESKYWNDIPKTRHNEIAVVLGGFRGTSSIKLAKKGYKVFVFEPVPEFAAEIQRKSRNLKERISVLEIAAATTAGQIEIVEKGEESFTVTHRLDDFRSAGGFVAKAVDFADWVKELDSTISLLEINIEGLEYEILSHLISQSVVSRINRINIQFHRIATTSTGDRAKIQSLLSQTHTQRWCFDWIWEVWDLNKS
jgi:FkbM family methyltransferase